MDMLTNRTVIKRLESGNVGETLKK